MIGSRLKLARAASGLSLRDLEERLGHLVTAQAIGKYERDEMMPGSEVLIALARALSVSEDYLMAPGPRWNWSASNFESNRLNWRSRARTRRVCRSSEPSSAIWRSKIFWRSRIEWQPPTDFPRRVRKPEDAEEAAINVRKAWKLGVDPIPALAEFLEVSVRSRSWPFRFRERVSGVVTRTSKKADGDKVQVIVLNAGHPGERQRFTLAHELGHVLLQAPIRSPSATDLPARSLVLRRCPARRTRCPPC